MNKLKQKFKKLLADLKKDKKTAIWTGILVVLVIISTALVVMGNWNTGLFKGAIVDPNFTITTAQSAIPTGTVGQPYGPFQFTTISVSSPVTYRSTWQSGNISGLTLNQQGQLSGTPSSSGTATLRVTATFNTSTDSPSKDYTITVNQAPITVAISSDTPPAQSIVKGTTGLIPILGVTLDNSSVPTTITSLTFTKYPSAGSASASDDIEYITLYKINGSAQDLIGTSQSLANNKATFGGLSLSLSANSSTKLLVKASVKQNADVNDQFSLGINALGDVADSNQNTYAASSITLPIKGNVFTITGTANPSLGVSLADGNPPSTQIQQGAIDQILMKFKLEATSANVTVSSIKIRIFGHYSVLTNIIAEMNLYDGNSPLGQFTINYGDKSATFVGTILITPGTPRTLTIKANIKSAAEISADIVPNLENNGITASGATINGLPISGNTFTIGSAQASLPDLIVQSLTLTNSAGVTLAADGTITVNTPLTIKSVIRNQGGANAGQSTAILQIHNRENYAIPLEEQNDDTGALAAGVQEGTQKTWSSWTPTAPASLRIRVCADQGNIIAESGDPNNNCTDVNIIVAAAQPPPPNGTSTPDNGGSANSSSHMPKPILQLPANGTTTAITTFTPTLNWQPGTGSPTNPAPYYEWYIKDDLAGSNDPDLLNGGSPSLATSECLYTVPNTTPKVKRWSCPYARIPAGILKYGHTYRWGVGEYGSLTEQWSDMSRFLAPSAPVVTVSASKPTRQSPTLYSGSGKLISPISINLDKSGGDETVDKIKSFTLVYAGNFPQSKLTNPQLYLEGEGESETRLVTQTEVALNKRPNGNIEVSFTDQGFKLPNIRKFVLYETITVANADAGATIRYSVQSVTVNPSEVQPNVRYTNGAIADALTVAAAGETMSCPLGSTAQNGQCTCLMANKQFYNPGNSSTPLASLYTTQCIPCAQASLVTYNGVLYCPADKPNPPPTPPVRPVTQSGTTYGTIVCASGFERIQTSSGVTCKQIVVQQAASGGGTNARASASGTAQKIITAGGNVKTGSTTYQQPYDNITRTLQPSAGQAGTTTTPVRAAAGTDQTTPDLRGSQRIVYMPERGNTGPEVLFYFAVLPIAWGLRRIKRK